MPIKPETRPRYPGGLFEPLASFISSSEFDAINTVRRMGCDPTRDFRFWEAMVSRIVGGTMTPSQCPWDVEIDLPWSLIPLRVEVKSSSEFMCKFNNGTRPVFKFALPHGVGQQKKPCEGIVLIGLDAGLDMHTWVVPAGVIKAGCKSLTITSPKRRVQASGRGYDLDRFACPPSQLLPELLRTLHYDRHHHAANSYATRKAKLNNLELAHER